ncbi:MAG: hypothetical protein EBQ96_02255 [Proteobacteria bacterium]|nr:hypothetical protein [Pseudomonadota bacterium]
MSSSKLRFALALILGGLASSLCPEVAEAQRSLAPIASETGAQTLQQLKDALKSGDTIKSIGRPAPGIDGCNGPNPHCVEVTTKSGKKFSILKGFLIHAAASCFAGVVSDGEAQRSIFGTLFLNAPVAEACFVLFEELKELQKVVAPTDIDIYCNDDNLYGFKFVTTIQGKAFPGDIASMREKAEALGMRVYINNSDEGAEATKLIDVFIEQTVHTPAVLTMTEMVGDPKSEKPELRRGVIHDLQDELIAAGVDVNLGKTQQGRARLSFVNQTSAVFADRRVIKHGDQPTRAKAIKDAFAGIEEFGKKINRAFKSVMDRIEKRDGPACIEVVAGNVRLTSRNAQFNPDGTCTSATTFQVGGKTYQINHGFKATIPRRTS